MIHFLALATSGSSDIPLSFDQIILFLNLVCEIEKKKKKKIVFYILLISMSRKQLHIYFITFDFTFFFLLLSSLFYFLLFPIKKSILFLIYFYLSVRFLNIIFIEFI